MVRKFIKFVLYSNKAALPNSSCYLYFIIKQPTQISWSVYINLVSAYCSALEVENLKCLNLQIGKTSSDALHA